MMLLNTHQSGGDYICSSVFSSAVELPVPTEALSSSPIRPCHRPSPSMKLASLGLVYLFAGLALTPLSTPLSTPLGTLLPPPASLDGTSLERAREGFQTKLKKQVSNKERPVKPPEGIELVHYDAPTGRANGYVAGSAPKGERRPAIIWLVGGFPAGGATASAFKADSYSNDQSAFQYRREGVITLYPSLRGTFGVPGTQELFLGEVDDVLAAFDYLRTRDDVDPGRIFLGGHSTGGTLALLVSEVTNEFRGIFSLGPVARPSEYGASNLPFDPKNTAEDHVRSPIDHLNGIKSSTFVLEGSGGNSR